MSEEKNNLREAYIKLIKGSLLNSISFDNELRILYLLRKIEQIKSHSPNNKPFWKRGNQIEIPSTEDLAKNLHRIDDFFDQPELTKIKADRKEGLHLENSMHLSVFADSMIGEKRMDNIHYCFKEVFNNNIEGDLIECGVWQGGATIFMKALLKAYGDCNRKVWVADSFEGLPVSTNDNDIAGFGDISKKVYPTLAVSQERVKANFEKYGLLDEQVKFLKGWFKDTLPQAPIDKIAILRLDGDLYESTMDALNALYDKVSSGGYVIIDDYFLEPCRIAVTEFRDKRSIAAPLSDIDGMGAYWKKD